MEEAVTLQNLQPSQTCYVGWDHASRSAAPGCARSIPSCRQGHRDSGVSSQDGARGAGAVPSSPLHSAFLTSLVPNKQQKLQENHGFSFWRGVHIFNTRKHLLYTHTDKLHPLYTYLKSHICMCKRNILPYNAVLLQVEDGSELKTW